MRPHAPDSSAPERGPSPETPTVLRLADLEGALGRHLGYSSWHDIGQERVNAFAEATGDRQWIHVDPERAKSSPFGQTVAHGYLTLSLGPALLDEVLRVEDAGSIINYGADRVRFPAPVPVGARVRLGVEAAAVSEVTGGAQVTFRFTFEIEGGSKPCCVADVLFRFLLLEQPTAGSGAPREVAG